MQFDKADIPDAPASPTCAACEGPIHDVYWEAGGRTFCQGCRDGHEAQSTMPGPGLAGFVKASLFGLAGGLAGAAVWFLVSHFAHLQIGLIAILVGWLVGKGVQLGTRRRGGRRWQVLAVIIAYLSVGLASAPELFLLENSQDVAWLPRAVWSVLVSPALPIADIVTSGASGIISAIILFIALQQAWSLNRKLDIQLSGPHRVALAAAPPPFPPGT